MLYNPAMTPSRDSLRTAILDLALAHAPFEGWNDAMLERAAARAAGDALEAWRLFPGGVAEMLEFFSERVDAAMLASLAAQNLPALKVRERIAAGVRTRLELLAPHREAVRRAAGYYALPHHAPGGAKRIWRTADAIWRAAGDASTDFNWYTKRLLLGEVYAATLLYWLNDASEAYRDSWAFLDRRIAEVLKFGGGLRKCGEKIERAADRAFQGIRRAAAGRIRP